MRATTALPKGRRTKGTEGGAPPPAYLRPRELAQRLAVCTANVYALIASGEMPAVRVGSAYRVPLDALLGYLARGAGPAGVREPGAASERKRAVSTGCQSISIPHAEGE